MDISLFLLDAINLLATIPPEAATAGIGTVLGGAGIKIVPLLKDLILKHKYAHEQKELAEVARKTQLLSDAAVKRREAANRAALAFARAIHDTIDDSTHRAKEERHGASDEVVLQLEIYSAKALERADSTQIFPPWLMNDNRSDHVMLELYRSFHKSIFSTYIYRHIMRRIDINGFADLSDAEYDTLCASFSKESFEIFWSVADEKAPQDLRPMLSDAKRFAASTDFEYPIRMIFAKVMEISKKSKARRMVMIETLAADFSDILLPIVNDNCNGSCI